MNPMNGSRGLTLVETLVVLALIAIMAGVAVIALPPFTAGQDFDDERRRIELLFRMIRSEAVLDSEEYGFALTPDGYEFMRYDDGAQEWVTLSETPFQARAMPETVRLRLEAENDALSFGGEGAPSVLMLSSGEMTPFRMTFESTPDGAVKVFASDGYEEPAWLEGQ